MRHRVFIVREWDAQVTGSGCCGRLGGLHHELGDADTFSQTRQRMVECGSVYEVIRDAFPEEDVEVNVVDPRNMVFLVPAIWRDAHRRMPAREALRQVLRGVASCALVADGRVLFSGEVPEPQVALAAVRREFSGPPSLERISG